MQREVAGRFGAAAREPEGGRSQACAPCPSSGVLGGDEHSCRPPAPGWRGGAGRDIVQGPLCWVSPRDTWSSARWRSWHWASGTVAGAGTLPQRCPPLAWPVWSRRPPCTGHMAGLPAREPLAAPGEGAPEPRLLCSSRSAGSRGRGCFEDGADRPARGAGQATCVICQDIMYQGRGAVSSAAPSLGGWASSRMQTPIGAAAPGWAAAATQPPVSPGCQKASGDRLRASRRFAWARAPVGSARKAAGAPHCGFDPAMGR